MMKVSKKVTEPKKIHHEAIVMRFLSRSADFGIYGAVIVKFGTKNSLRKL